MLNPKTNDLAILADFLEREHRRFKSIRQAREAILRIGSLMNAEAHSRAALESAEADLAWARAQIEAAGTNVLAAQEAARRKIDIVRGETEAAIQRLRLRQDEEAKRLDGMIAEKRATLSRLMAHIEALRARGLDVAVSR